MFPLTNEKKSPDLPERGVRRLWRAPQAFLPLSLLIAGLMFSLLVGCCGAAMAETNALADDGSVDDSWPQTGPGDTRLSDYFPRYPAAAVFGPKNKDNPLGHDEIENRKSKGPGQVTHSKSGPVYIWPIPIPTATSAVPTKRDEGINENMLQTFGLPISDTQYQMIHRWDQQIMLEQMFDPEKMMWLGAVMGNTQAQDTSNAMANNIRNQSASAIDFVGCSIYNFTVDDSNKWNKVRNELFLPMAILLLLPGAVLAQVKAIVAAGMPVHGDVHPFDGIIRSIVAIFLIPATYLVVNYGIDVNNSITFTIWDEYKRIFGTDMYKDALCTVVRAFPIRQATENRNAMDKKTVEWKPKLNLPADKRTPATPLEARTLAVKYEDPCTGQNETPEERNDERAPFLSTGQRMITNTGNAALASAWNILCAFQVAFLFYLWFVGPVVAALWVYPMNQLRSALGSWVEGVITLCFWSLFWNTTVLLFACFKGVDETGSIITSALMFLSTASVKYAFDFAGLVKEAGSSAAGQAMGAAKSMGKGASPGGAQSGGHKGGSTSGGKTGGSVGSHGGAHTDGKGHSVGSFGDSVGGHQGITGGTTGTAVSGTLTPTGSIGAGNTGGDKLGVGSKDGLNILGSMLPPGMDNAGPVSGNDLKGLLQNSPIPGMDVTLNSITAGGLGGIPGAAGDMGVAGLGMAGLAAAGSTFNSLTAGGADITNLSNLSNLSSLGLNSSSFDISNSANYNLLGGGPGGGPGGLTGAAGQPGGIFNDRGGIVAPGTEVSKQAAFAALENAKNNTQNLNVVDPQHAQQRNDALKAFQDELMNAEGASKGSSFEMTQGLNVAMQGQIGDMALGNTAIAQGSFSRDAANVGGDIQKLLSSPDGKTSPQAMALAQEYNNLYKNYQDTAAGGPMSTQQLLNYSQDMNKLAQNAEYLRTNPGQPTQMVDASVAQSVANYAQTARSDSAAYQSVAYGNAAPSAMPYYSQSSTPSGGDNYNFQQGTNYSSGGTNYSSGGTTYPSGGTVQQTGGTDYTTYASGGGYVSNPGSPQNTQYYPQSQGDVQLSRSNYDGGSNNNYVQYNNQAQAYEYQYRAPTQQEGYNQYVQENNSAFQAAQNAYQERYGHSYNPEVTHNYNSSYNTGLQPQQSAYMQQEMRPGVQPSNQHQPTHQDPTHLAKTSYTSSGSTGIFPMGAPPVRTNPLRGGFGFFKSSAPTQTGSIQPMPKPSQSAPQPGPAPQPKRSGVSGSLSDEVWRGKMVRKQQKRRKRPDDLG